jgi:hypothetical protein
MVISKNLKEAIGFLVNSLTLSKTLENHGYVPI